MTHPSKRKGDSAELEVQAMLREELGVPARRALGAGRKDDCGDIDGVPVYNVAVHVMRRDFFVFELDTEAPDGHGARLEATV